MDRDNVDVVLAQRIENRLQFFAENDEIIPEINSQSRVTFSVIAGTTYRIAVDGYYGAAGSVVLNWANVSGPPVNDKYIP